MDQRGFPTSIPDFHRAFADAGACARYLEHLRWPDGFVCPKCGAIDAPYRFPKRQSVVLRCRNCQSNISLTAGTAMHGSRMALSTWFWGAYLMTTQTPGMSAVQFQRQLGISRYETAFQVLHKLRAGMIRPDRDTVGTEWPVEVDETLVGGRTRGEGRGIHHKALVAGAIEVRQRPTDKTGRKHRNAHYAGRLRLSVVADREGATLTRFVQKNVAAKAVVRTDGWGGYGNLVSLGYAHESVVLKGDGAKIDGHLPAIHIAFSNLKTWLMGTHHGVSKQHLQAYLNEFTFRFNRRFYPMTAFNSILGLASHTEAPTYDSLYHGLWTHPGA